MKRTIFIFQVLLSFFSYGNDAGESKVNFMVRPFTPAFIENKGQYDAYDVNFEQPNFKRAYYGSQLGNSIILFTGNAIQFVQNIQMKGEKEMEEKNQEPGFETFRQILSFPGANADPEIIVSDQRSDYFTFSNPLLKNETNRAAGWNQLTVKNIYPGIDMACEYKQEGIKYSFIINPGSDPSQIKMQWTGTYDIKIDAEGKLMMNSPNGIYTDTAPLAYYTDDASTVSSDFSLDHGIISFSLGSYDHTRPFMIDPWITNPGFTNFNSGYDIQHDPSGNVYVYGGANPYQLIKYSSIGVPLWTYNTNAQGYYGDFTIDQAGDIYCIYGPWTDECLKLDSAGNIVWQSVNLSHPTYVETYRIMQNPLTGLLNIIGMDRLTGFNPMAETVDPFNGAFSNYYYHPTCTVGETRALIIDANGDLYAMIFSAGGPFSFSNMLWKMDAGFNTIITVTDGYLLGELEQTYTDTWYNGYNGMAVNATSVYTYDGEIVKRWDKNTLTFLGSAIIPGGIHYITGGLCADACGNIYVGGPNSIIQYDSTLTFLTSVATTGHVHDVNLGAAPGEILGCGSGFAGSFSFPVCLGPMPVAIFTAPNHICPGTCTDFINQSSNGLTFQWFFPGGTPSSSSVMNPVNICYNTSGSYDVTLIVSNGLGSDTLLLNNFITVYPQPPPQGIQQVGDTLFAIPGAVSYQWYNGGNQIPGATEYFYIAEASGDYNVVATDVNGCEVEAAIFDVIAGLSPIQKEGLVRLHPNPVSNELTIDCLYPAKYEISICNVPGEIIYSATGIGQSNIDCRYFPAGMYYITISKQEEIFRMKFIKD
jgi:PKD repeat protein